jgi:trehalose/maltose hydrolase-like predicted phosphorylase
LSFSQRAETVFALSNRYLGVRGTLDEGRPAHAPGTFINGFYESWPVRHPGQAFGLATTGQTIVLAPNATILQLYVDDEPLFLPVAQLPHHLPAVLDRRSGTLDRDLVWSTAAGKHVHLPRQWESLEFTLRVQDRRLRIALTHTEECCRLDEGEPLQVTIRGQFTVITADHPTVLPGAPRTGMAPAAITSRPSSESQRSGPDKAVARPPRHFLRSEDRCSVEAGLET